MDSDLLHSTADATATATADVDDGTGTGDFYAATGGSQATEEPAEEPAEGSDAAASLEFGRNLTRLREQRGLSHNKLAALADIAPDSIRDYELGKYRPQKPSLWALAKSLDVMPIVLGSSSTRKGEPPVPVELLLQKKGSRSLRLQYLVELIATGGLVSRFAEQAEQEVEDVYAVASSDVQLNEEQLEPFLTALPQVRRAWLMSGTGEPLQPVSAPAMSPPVDAPPAPLSTREEAPIQRPAAELTASGLPRTQGADTSGFMSVPGRIETGLAHPAALPMPLTPLTPLTPALSAGDPLYVPLGGGVVAEVDALLLAGTGAVTGFRLLAGAGGVVALTSADQLERLFHALSGVLDQRAAE